MAVHIPKYHDLLWPVLNAVKALGGSGSNQEIYDKVVELEGFSEEQQDFFDPKSKNSTQPKLEYNTGWARWYLGRFGALESSKRGVWSITDLGESLTKSDMAEIPSKVRAISQRNTTNKESKSNESAAETSPTWRDILLEKLWTIEPVAFERLCKRILRESGFIKVDVTQQSNDGGIDGMGTLRVNLLSFHVVFQAKRYRGSVGAPEIQKFRGAMMGRGEKGLFITTGTFTKQARDEANRDGSSPVDLIDGEDLCNLLKELSLGVEVKQVEEVEVNTKWFDSI